MRPDPRRRVRPPLQRSRGRPDAVARRHAGARGRRAVLAHRPCASTAGPPYPAGRCDDGSRGALLHRPAGAEGAQPRAPRPGRRHDRPNRWAQGLDVFVEGTAVRVTDPETLQAPADAFEAKYGNVGTRRRRGVFHHGAGTAFVFRVEPAKVLAFAKAAARPDGGPLRGPVVALAAARMRRRHAPVSTTALAAIVLAMAALPADLPDHTLRVTTRRSRPARRNRARPRLHQGRHLIARHRAGSWRRGPT